MWRLLRRWKWALPITAALAFALLALKSPRSAGGSVERKLSPLASFFVEGPARLTRRVRDFGSHFRGLWGAEERARKLEEELSLLRLEYRQLEESYQRAQARNRSLEVGRRWLTQLVPANLLARDPSTWFHVVLLDRGLADGVQVGAGVVSPLGVVGKVIRSQEDSCKVVFLTDNSCRIAVRLARSRILAILTGDGRKACRLDYLSGHDDVKVGDLVETAPGSLNFPSGIPAGTVVKVEKVDNGLKLSVDVVPSADLSRLESLYIAGRRK